MLRILPFLNTRPAPQFFRVILRALICGRRAANRLVLHLAFGLLLAGWAGLPQNAAAQAVTLNTNFPNNNGAGITTFNLHNSNSFDVLITEVGSVTGITGPQTAELYYKTTPLNGPPGAISAANGWILAASGNFNGIGNLSTSVAQPIITGAAFTLPAGVTYAIAVSSVHLQYSDLPPGLTTVSAGGLNLLTGTNIGYGGGVAPAAPTFTPRGFIGYLTFVPASACVAPPQPGQATSTVASICPNLPFRVALSGASGGSGMTYQWQTSANGTTGWSDISGATQAEFTATQAATTWYRAVLSCAGQQAISQPVQVITNTTPVTGTFTIDKGSPASATNFQSFAAAIASIACGGASGPIVFNVAPNSGPYREHVVIPALPGTSAGNTVTFNGQGNRLQGTSGAGLPVLQLTGADFIRINDLVIESEATVTTGPVVQLTNGADQNIFTGNTLTHPGSLASAANSQVVSITGGSNNHNVFQNNTLTGGYYGIYHYGSAATLQTGNQFSGNTLKDMHFAGIYNFYTAGTLIEGNTISRPTRTISATTYFAMYLGGANRQVTVSKNRLHNPFGGFTSTTLGAYGIYVAESDAPAGSENIFQNNLLYHFNTNGLIYGIYNNGSDGTHFFHNTISLDQATNAGSVRGFYQQTAAANVVFKNNLVAVNAGTGGNKFAVYFGTAASSIQSDHNVLHAPGANVGYSGGSFATLALWQTANGGAYDQHSVAAAPLFANLPAGDLQPTAVAINNAGNPIPTVTDDLLGNPRSTTTPDPGAYEFSVNPHDVGITAVSGPVSGCGISAAQAITVTLKNFGTTAQTSVPVSYSVNGVSQPGTPEMWTGNLAPNATITYTFNTTANMSLPGFYQLEATTHLPNDPDTSNNSARLAVTNALMTGLPAIDFETPAAGLQALHLVSNSKSSISESAAASLPLHGAPATSTKGLLMEGTSITGWVMPVGLVDTWTSNPDHFSGIYLCFNPQGAANPGQPLWLSFDLKQLFKTANANTNFRVTVNGTQVGPTYRPPFAGTPIDWQKVYVDLTPYAQLLNIQVGLESSVAEPYAGGAGTANLIDNIRFQRVNPTGITNKAFQSSINVYPNPSNGVFAVTVPTVKAFTLEVTDLTGKVVMRQAVKGSNQAQLDLHGNAQGVYLLKITSEGASAVQKIILE